MRNLIATLAAFGLGACSLINPTATFAPPDSGDGDAAVPDGGADASPDGSETDADMADAPISCGDGMQNGTETDIDCGGSECSACGTDQTCGGNLDCTSRNCVGGVCFAPTCVDGIQNQDETKIDCGGTVCSECPPSEVIDIAVGAEHSCALLDTGDVRCWGEAENGQLGYGNTNDIGDNETPRSAGNVDIGGKATQITAGGSHTCALLENGEVRCWGLNNWGQLGYANMSNIGDNEVPADAGSVDVGGRVEQIDAGSLHTCAVLVGGSVRCWGFGMFGRLGYGNTDHVGDNEAPRVAGDVDVGGIVTQVSAGNVHTCARLETGEVRCWGDSNFGELGYGNRDRIGDNELPSAAGSVDVGGPVARVEAGGHTCAVLQTGEIRCWGLGTAGALGYGNTTSIGNDETPRSAGSVDIGGTVTDFAVGLSHTCAVLGSGATRCWGDGRNGQLGYRNTENVGDNETPATQGSMVVGTPVAKVDAAGGVFGDHSCAILVNGQVACWGSGGDGRLGYGDTENVGDNETPATAGTIDLF